MIVAPFDRAGLTQAAQLFAERHRRGRTWEPLLPAAFECVEAALSELVVCQASNEG